MQAHIAEAWERVGPPKAERLVRVQILVDGSGEGDPLARALSQLAERDREIATLQVRLAH